MGNIEKFIKCRVLEVLKMEQFHTDISRELINEGYGFEIIRENGKTLKYDGLTRKFEYK